MPGDGADLRAGGKELEPKARFVKVNVDNEPELAGRLGVQGIPALFVLKHGSAMARQAGLANLATLEKWVQQFNPLAQRAKSGPGLSHQTMRCSKSGASDWIPEVDLLRVRCTRRGDLA
nr:thioredoxin domain-containing protein [Microvirga makkahensis]